MISSEEVVVAVDNEKSTHDITQDLTATYADEAQHRVVQENPKVKLNRHQYIQKYMKNDSCGKCAQQKQNFKLRGFTKK